MHAGMQVLQQPSRAHSHRRDGLVEHQGIGCWPARRVNKATQLAPLAWQGAEEAASSQVEGCQVFKVAPKGRECSTYAVVAW